MNEWEQANILEAEKWLLKKTLYTQDILNLQFLKKVHHEMFKTTWRWSGQFRTSNKNIGVMWEMIPNNLKLLLDDIVYQLENNIYDPNEIAVRFHHRLVLIHAFANGNGRHARLVTDLFLISQKQPRFSWGFNSTKTLDLTRKQYITALRAADKHNYQLLIDFVRS